MSFFTNVRFLIKNFNNILYLNKEKEIAEILIKNKLKISSAESCTGGLLSSRLTDVSGSSDYVYNNLVTYSNDSKEKLLNVKHNTLKNYGAVSYEVSLEMAQGLLKRYNCDIAISTTGIAGPTGGTKEKPVGLVYITIANKTKSKTYKYLANPNLSRVLIKYDFTNTALDYLLTFLKANY